MLDLNTYSIVVAAMFTTVVFILSKRLTAVEQTTTEQKRAEKDDGRKADDNRAEKGRKSRYHLQNQKVCMDTSK